MKVDFVEISGFRGFRDKTRFELPSGFAVLCGRNGAGKSTVLDAIDFALTGTINKFEVRNARGGGLDEHIWWVGDGKASAHYVSVGFVGPDGQPFIITRNRDTSLQSDPRQVMDTLCSGGPAAQTPKTLIQTSLIRDEFIVALSLDLPEQQRFEAVRTAIGGLLGPDYSERTSEILKAANAARELQKARLGDVQSELGRALGALTEARSIAERSPDVSEAIRTIDSLSIKLPADPRERTDGLRKLVADRRRVLRDIEDARIRSESLVSELTHLNSSEVMAQEKADKAARDAAFKNKEQAEQRLALALRAQTTEQESDTYAAHFTALLEHGTALGLQDDHCPLCNAFRSSAEFKTAVDAARTQLAARSEKMVAASKEVEKARAELNSATQSLSAIQDKLTDLERRRQASNKALLLITELYKRNGFAAPADDPKTAQLAMLAQQEQNARLERALFTLEASTAVDRVTTLETQISTLRTRIDDETKKLDSADKAAEAARQIDTSAKAVANQILTEQFDTVMPLLKELYRRLRPHTDWIEIESDFKGKVRASLNFTVGDHHNVQFLFSSGQRRAAGLAFLLAIHLSRRWCNWQTLLLDDPVQHIDDYRALNLVEVLAAIRRSGRQVIVAVEDVALADVLCRRLRSGIGDIGRRFDLRTSQSGSAEIASTQDVCPMPRSVLRPAEAS